MKPKAYSYVRMSTDLQLKGDSLRRQTEISAKYAEENNLELADDYKFHDIGISAFRGDNLAQGALGEFFGAIEAGLIPQGSFLLVESLDRLSRQRIQKAVELFLGIINRGINIVTLTDRKVYTAADVSIGDLMQSIIVMATANEESEKKSQRVSHAWQNKRNKIKQVPLTRLCPHWLTMANDGRSYLPVPDRVKIVQQIFAFAASGLGSNAITKWLNQNKIKPFGKSDGWTESYITKTLKNRAVLGEFQPHQKLGGQRIPVGEVIQDYFPAIVPEDVFLSVQIGRRKRRQGHAGRRGENQRNLFTNIAKCAYCKRPMYYIDKGPEPKGGQYLQCSGAQKGLGCEKKLWRYSDFEKAFLLYCRDINLPDIIGQFEARSAKAALLQAIEIKIEQLDHLQQRRDKTYDLLMNGAAVDYVTTKLNEITSEIEAVQLQINELERQSAVVEAPKEVSDVELLNIIEALQHSGPEAIKNRQLVASKLKDIVISLTVATAGDGPLIQKFAELIRDLNDKEYEEKLLRVRNETSKEFSYQHPFFTVSLKEGVVQRVVVLPDGLAIEDKYEAPERLDDNDFEDIPAN